MALIRAGTGWLRGGECGRLHLSHARCSYSFLFHPWDDLIIVLLFFIIYFYFCIISLKREPSLWWVGYWQQRKCKFTHRSFM